MSDLLTGRRILLVVDSYPPCFGGVATSAKRIRDELAKHGNHVTVLTTSRGTQPELRKAEDAKEVLRVGQDAAPISTKDFIIQGLLHLSNRNYEFDVILCLQANAAAFLGAAYGTLLGIPYVISCRGSDINRKISENPSAIHSLRPCLEKAAFVTAVSEEIRSKLLELGCPKEKVQVVKNGVDIERFAPGSTASVHDILFIGAARAIKGWHDALYAIGCLKRPVKVLACLYPHSSEPEYFEDLLKNLKQLPKNISVEIEEPRPFEAMSEVYAKSRVVIVPSLSEGCSNVVLEAMASGKRIVARDIASIKSVLGTFGAYFESPQELTNRIEETLDIPREADLQWGEELRAFVQREYCTLREVERYSGVLETALKKKSENQ